MIRSITGLLVFRLRMLLAVTLIVLAGLATAQTTPAQPKTAQSKTAQTNPDQTNPDQTKTPEVAYPAALADSGKTLFGQNCAFCHGRDAGGGESGPDLMDSDLVTSDVRGDKIGPFVRNGRPENGMPAFKLSPQEVSELAAFLHTQKQRSE